MHLPQFDKAYVISDIHLGGRRTTCRVAEALEVTEVQVPAGGALIAVGLRRGLEVAEFPELAGQIQT